jgi:hypothetical protein
MTRKHLDQLLEQFEWLATFLSTLAGHTGFYMEPLSKVRTAASPELWRRWEEMAIHYFLTTEGEIRVQPLTEWAKICPVQFHGEDYTVDSYLIGNKATQWQPAPLAGGCTLGERLNRTYDSYPENYQPIVLQHERRPSQGSHRLTIYKMAATDPVQEALSAVLTQDHAWPS